MFVVHWRVQRELVKKHCLGDCGMVMNGALDFGDLGVMLPCGADECKHTDDTFDLGVWELPIEGYRNITVRRLRETR